jgi:hypothetical protein
MIIIWVPYQVPKGLWNYHCCIIAIMNLDFQKVILVDIQWGKSVWDTGVH